MFSGEYRPAYVVADIRRRALLVWAVCWIAAGVVYLLVTFASDGPEPGCGGIGCLSDQGMLLTLGMCFLLPVALFVMAASAIFIFSLSRTARSGPALGVQVAAAGFGVVLTLAAVLLIMS